MLQTVQLALGLGKLFLQCLNFLVLVGEVLLRLFLFFKVDELPRLFLLRPLLELLFQLVDCLLIVLGPLFLLLLIPQQFLLLLLKIDFQGSIFSF